MPNKDRKFLSDIHLGAKTEHEKAVEKVAENIRKRTHGINRGNAACIAYPFFTGDAINLKEDKGMYKSDLDLLTGQDDWTKFQVNMEQFSDRGFVIKVIYKDDVKREFVE